MQNMFRSNDSKRIVTCLTGSSDKLTWQIILVLITFICVGKIFLYLIYRAFNFSTCSNGRSMIFGCSEVSLLPVNPGVKILYIL